MYGVSDADVQRPVAATCRVMALPNKSNSQSSAKPSVGSWHAWLCPRRDHRLIRPSAGSRLCPRRDQQVDTTRAASSSAPESDQQVDTTHRAARSPEPPSSPPAAYRARSPRAPARRRRAPSRPPARSRPSARRRPAARSRPSRAARARRRRSRAPACPSSTIPSCSCGCEWSGTVAPGSNVTRFSIAPSPKSGRGLDAVDHREGG